MISKIKRNLVKKRNQLLFTLLVALLSIAILPVDVLAMPENKDAAGATVTNNAIANQMTINQTANSAVLNWNKFNIAKGEMVTFNQPSAKAIAYNKILDNNASQIMGSLRANGHVFLQNPNGILFGAGAQINVGGLIATTLKTTIDPSGTTFSLLRDSSSIGKIINKGSITASNGKAILIAPQVENYGAITSNQGIVIDTNSATQLTSYDLFGDKSITLEVQGSTGNVVNTSNITSAGMIVEQDGLVYLEGTLDGSNSSIEVSGKNIVVSQASVKGPTTLGAANSILLLDSKIDAGGGIAGRSLSITASNTILGSHVYLFGNPSSHLDAGRVVLTGDGALQDISSNSKGYYSSTITKVGSTNLSRMSVADNPLKSAGYMSQANYIDTGSLGDFYNLSSSNTFGSNAGMVITVNTSNNRLAQVVFGTHTDDRVGSDGVLFGDGGYMVKSSNYDGGKGAVSIIDLNHSVNWIGAGNSLIGANTGDYLGGKTYTFTRLSNYNYVISNPEWSNNRGIAAYMNLSNPYPNTSFGTVSADNSLVGSNSGDKVSSGGIVEVGNSNYLVISPQWNMKSTDGSLANRGAVTWGDGRVGAAGAITVANSLVGTSQDDLIGSNGVYVFKNGNSKGNYLLLSPNYDYVKTDRTGVQQTLAQDCGAITWGNGNKPLTGVVDQTKNSLVGTYGTSSSAHTEGDSIGQDVVISNSSYAKAYKSNDNIANINLATKNGTRLRGGIIEFSNGDYAIDMPYWAAGKGAVVFAKGTETLSGIISSGQNGNALSGFYAAKDWAKDSQQEKLNALDATNVPIPTGDQFGSGGIVEYNGKYIILSPNWSNGRGMVSILNNTCTGTINFGGSSLKNYKESNWVGSNTALYIGSMPNSFVGSGGLVDLGNGKLALLSPNYTYVDTIEQTIVKDKTLSYINCFDFGKITANGITCFLDPVKGMTGLVGDVISGIQKAIGVSQQEDTKKIITKANTNAGAVTILNTANIKGTSFIYQGNSFLGSTPQDKVGSQVKLLSNGNMLVAVPTWSNNRGALSFIKRDNPVVGKLSEENSYVGRTYAGDGKGAVGNDQNLITDINQVYEVGRGNYLLVNPDFKPWVRWFIRNNSGGEKNGENGGNFKTGIAAWGDGKNGLLGVVGDYNWSYAPTGGFQPLKGIVGGINIEGCYMGGDINFTSLDALYILKHIFEKNRVGYNGVEGFASGGVKINPNGSFVITSNYKNGKTTIVTGDGNTLLEGCNQTWRAVTDFSKARLDAIDANSDIEQSIADINESELMPEQSMDTMLEQRNPDFAIRVDVGAITQQQVTQDTIRVEEPTEKR